MVKDVKLDDSKHFSEMLSHLSTANVLPTNISTIKTRSVKTESSIEDNMYFTNYLKKLDVKNDPKHIVKQNYEKYKSVRLATEETKRYMATKSTGFYSVATSTKYNPVGPKNRNKANNTVFLPILNFGTNRSTLRNSGIDNKLTRKTVNELKRSSFI
jgi:hypothetical protein